MLADRGSPLVPWSAVSDVARWLMTSMFDDITLAQPPLWTRLAACDGTDPGAWFPPRGQTVPDELVALCGRCPVATECLEFALAEHEELPAGDAGVWAGTTPRQRAAMVARRRQLAA